MIATSNFVNTTGAILATVLFKFVVLGAHATGLAPPVTTGRTPVGTGVLSELALSQGRPVYFAVTQADGTVVTGGTRPPDNQTRDFGQVLAHVFEPGAVTDVVELAKAVPTRLDPATPFRADVSKFTIGGVTHYDLTAAGVPPTPDYDNRHLPRYLFLGAAILTAGMLVVSARPLLRVGRAER